jgi:hypothetical protein
MKKLLIGFIALSSLNAFAIDSANCDLMNPGFFSAGTVKPFAYCTIIIEDPFVDGTIEPEGGRTTEIESGCLFKAIRSSDKKPVLGVSLRAKNNIRSTIINESAFETYKENKLFIKLEGDVHLPGKYEYHENYTLNKYSSELKYLYKIRNYEGNKLGKWKTYNSIRLGCRFLNE